MLPTLQLSVPADRPQPAGCTQQESPPGAAADREGTEGVQGHSQPLAQGPLPRGHSG